ncbi:MAG: META domain-containing protein [Parvularculaceae bacterium]
MRLIPSALAAIAISLGGLAVTGCAATTTGATNTNDDAMTTISGSITYRERILPPKDSYAVVQLNDVSRADAPAETLAEDVISLNGKSVSVEYNLTVDADILDPRMTYAVRAKILDNADALLWTSDSVHRIDPLAGDQTLDMIILKRVESSANAVSSTLTDGSWQVESINGVDVIDTSKTSIAFGEDGRIVGVAGCNRFSADYSAHGGLLQIGAAAVTERACVPALADQEQRFFDVFNNITRYAYDANGVLLLNTDDGRTIRASR